MNKLGILITLVFCSFNITKGQVDDFSKTIDALIKHSVPTIHPNELIKNYTAYTILDTRDLKEYNTSHLKDAKHVGYESFNLKNTISTLDKSKQVLVYCTVGYRSEKIGEKLQNMGFEVYNLYGGIINWKNNSFPVFNSKNLAN